MDDSGSKNSHALLLKNSSPYKRGFTLVELMITIAVLAILASIAYPGFQTSIQNSRQTSQLNSLFAALQLARSEATSRGNNITICGSNDQASCNDADWSDGFIIHDNGNVLKAFEDLNGNRLRASDGALTVDAGVIVFNDEGLIDNFVTLSVCDARGTASARSIQLNASGQARIAGVPAC